MKAVVAYNNKAVLSKDRPLPKLRDDYILVKVIAVALNPTDWKHIDRNLVGDGALIGSDFSGIVEEVGKSVTKHWTKGDRVAGVTHGGNILHPEDGAFAEYIIAKGDVQLKIPESMSFEKAATIPLSAVTVMQGLYQKGLRMNLPDNPISEKTFVLIYGGSTAAGALGIQYAKLGTNNMNISGYTVISTCSPKNFEYVKGLGVDEVFNYRDNDVGAKIREFTQNKLKLAWDTVSQEQSARICGEALSSDATGSRYASFLSNKCPREGVESVGTNMYTIFGEYFSVGSLEYPASLEDFEWAKKFTALTEKLLAAGKIKPHREKVGSGGLEGVLQGLDDLRNNNYSGEKLVFKIAATSDVVN